VSWSCKELHQELRYREKRYPDNHRVACGTTRASGRQVADTGRSRELGSSQGESPNIGSSSHEDARLRKRDRRVSAFRHLGYQELEARGLGVASSEVAIVRGCDRAKVPIRWEKVSVD
jgi:hypothetical protein